MPQSWDMGHIILLPFRRKAYWGFSGCPKNPTASARFEPANSGSSVRHWYVSCRFLMTAYQAESGCSILVLHASCRPTCITCASAECTVAHDGQRNYPKHIEIRTRINLEISAFCWFHSKEIIRFIRNYYIIVSFKFRCKVPWRRRKCHRNM